MMSIRSSDMPKLIRNGANRSLFKSFIPVRDYSVSNFAELRNPSSIAPVKIGLKNEPKVTKPAAFTPKPPKIAKPECLRRSKVLKLPPIVRPQEKQQPDSSTSSRRPNIPGGLKSEAPRSAGNTPKPPKELKPQSLKSPKIQRLPSLAKLTRELKPEFTTIAHPDISVPKNDRICGGLYVRKERLPPMRNIVAQNEDDIYVHKPRDPWHRKIMEEARARDGMSKESIQVVSLTKLPDIRKQVF